MKDEPPSEAEHLEWRMTIVVSAAALLVVALVGLATIPKGRIAAIRANGGYVLVDNRTRRAVVVVTGTEDGRACGKTRVSAGNRGRVRACGAWSRMLVQGQGGDFAAARLMAAQGQVYQVRRRGVLTAEQHDAF
jgi:hypothetical protein